MFDVWNKIDSKRIGVAAKHDLKQEYATRYLYGIEKDSFLAKIAKAYMAVLGDGRAGIYVEDSLNEESWSSSTIAGISEKIRYYFDKFTIW